VDENGLEGNSPVSEPGRTAMGSGDAGKALVELVRLTIGPEPARRLKQRELSAAQLEAQSSRFNPSVSGHCPLRHPRHARLPMAGTPETQGPSEGRSDLVLPAL